MSLEDLSVPPEPLLRTSGPPPSWPTEIPPVVPCLVRRPGVVTVSVSLVVAVQDLVKLAMSYQVPRHRLGTREVDLWLCGGSCCTLSLYEKTNFLRTPSEAGALWVSTSGEEITSVP